MSKLVNSVIFNGYKSFSKGTSQEINIAPCITVFIGKNNGGKSTCVDVLESVFSLEYYNKNHASFSQITVSLILNDETISRHFSKNCGGGDIPFPGMHYTYGSRFIGKTICGDLTAGKHGAQPTLTLSKTQPDLELPHGKLEWQSAIQGLHNYRSLYEFRRINADGMIIDSSRWKWQK